MTALPEFDVSSARMAENARSRISYLSTLRANWNTYGSPPIAEQAIQTAYRLLETVRQQGAPGPQIVPSSDGGIQFEWHLPGQRLEIEIDDAGKIAYFYADATAEVEDELSGVCDRLTLDLLGRLGQ